jgi:hypothetical protein
MKTLLSALLLFLFIISAYSQNNSISFANNSSVNVGSSVGNGLRTIEMWIRPSTNITSNLSEFQIPIHRNTEFCGNCDEFAFAFDPIYSSSSTGYLRFKVHDANGTKYEVSSNSNFWRAGQWYHIAGVIDPVQGMMLFVDGLKQVDTEPNCTFPTTNSSAITVIGAQGNRFDRHFYGEIDEVRLSSAARYTSNFTPSCQLAVDSMTSSLYKFDLISNNKTPDLVSSYSGIVNSAILSSNNACGLTVGRDDLLAQEAEVIIYPNPFKDQLNIKNLMNPTQTQEVIIHDLGGKLLLRSALSGGSNQIKTELLPSGFYFLSVWQNGALISREKLIKQ